MENQQNHNPAEDSRSQRAPDTISLGGLAQQLRQVRQASRDFILLWAFEQLLRDPKAMKRVASDLADTLAGSEATEAALADPFDHNWSIMYRGSVLDD